MVGNAEGKNFKEENKSREGNISVFTFLSNNKGTSFTENNKYKTSQR